MIHKIVQKVSRLSQIGKNLPGNLIENPVIVLCYHRVTELTADPYELAISPKNFCEQIKYISENFSVKRFEENWDFRELAFVITFDDGYADNLYNALPVLQKFNVPATIFVTPGFTDSGREFPWDGGNTPARPEYQQLSQVELRQLSNEPLITLGSHTLTHRQLSSLTPQEQEEEILGGHKMLGNIIGKKLTTMSYPFGNYCDIDENCKKICRLNGIARAAANYPGQAHSWTDSMAIPRHIIRNYGAAEFRKRLTRFRFL